MPGTTPTQDDDAISSFLWKRSRHLRVWRKRRAVLRSSGFLTLHRGEAIRAAIALSPECRVERAPEAHRALFAFLITGPGLRVYLGADSEAEAIRWVLLLGERCRSEVVEPPLEPAARWFNGAPAQQQRVQWPQAAASSSAAAAATTPPEQLLETAQQLEADVVAELRGWPAMHSAVLRALRAAAAFPPPPTDRQWTCLESAETKLRLLASSSTGLTQPVWAREGHQLGEFLESNALQMWKSRRIAAGRLGVLCQHVCADEPRQVLADAGSLLPARMSWDRSFVAGRILRRSGRHTMHVQHIFAIDADGNAATAAGPSSSSSHIIEVVVQRFEAMTVGGRC